MVLPPGVTFDGSSNSNVQPDTDIVRLDPVEINTKGKLRFTVTVRIGSGAEDRITFRTFLDDMDAYCEATDALTVRTDNLWISSGFNI